VQSFTYEISRNIGSYNSGSVATDRERYLEGNAVLSVVMCFESFTISESVEGGGLICSGCVGCVVTVAIRAADIG
jgi:hypothetical protein